MFRYGIVKKMGNAHIVCLLYFDTIDYCMEEGHGKKRHLRGGGWVRGRGVLGFVVALSFALALLLWHYRRNGQRAYRVPTAFRYDRRLYGGGTW